MNDAALINAFLQPYHGNVVGLVQAAAAIPWGEGRTIEEVLGTKRVGTCTGKHLVLQRCLDAFGIPYRPVVCTFRWGDQPMNLPSHLRTILEEGEWEHGHNFIQLQQGSTWVDVDIIWDPFLKAFGFRSFPAQWDGASPHLGIEKILQRWDGVDFSEKKAALLGALTPEMRERRERFLHGFIQWVDSLRTPGRLH
jgi:hypothetical protein